MSNLQKLPDFTQLDLFSVEFSDIATRMVQDVMWRPFFALGKKPRFEPIIYKTDSAEIMVVGSKPFGIATIFDEDILMWLVSQIVEARDEGRETSPQISFTPYECLQGIYRSTGGKEYKLLKDGLRRLHTTSVHTTIRRCEQTSLANGKKQVMEAGFHWLEGYGFNITEHNGKEVIKGITVVLPNWLYQAAIKPKEVLTLHEDYLLLTSGFDRYLYKIARKHTGRQTYYSLSMQQLYEKMGSQQRFSDFAIKIRKRVEANELPDYYMMLSPKYYKVMCEGHSIELPKHLWEQETVTFWNKEKLLLSTLPKLSTG